MTISSHLFSGASSKSTVYVSTMVLCACVCVVHAHVHGREALVLLHLRCIWWVGIFHAGFIWAWIRTLLKKQVKIPPLVLTYCTCQLMNMQLAVHCTMARHARTDLQRSDMPRHLHWMSVAASTSQHRGRGRGPPEQQKRSPSTSSTVLVMSAYNVLVVQA